MSLRRKISIIPLIFLLTSVCLGGSGFWSANGPEYGAVQSIAVDPRTPDTIYFFAATGYSAKGTVFKSIDGGESWFPSGSGLPESRICFLVIQPPPYEEGIIFAGTDNSVYRSADGGESWDSANDGLPEEITIFDLALDPRYPPKIYAASSQGIFKTMDSGVQWFPSSTGLPDTEVKSLAIDPEDPSRIFAGTVRNGLYQSDNGGQTWDKMVNEFGETTVNVLFINPRSPSTIFANTYFDYARSTYRSADGGDSWSEVGDLSGLVVYDFTVDPTQPDVVYAATWHGIYKSVDGGSHWSRSSEGLPAPDDEPESVLSVCSHPQKAGTIFAGTRASGFYISTDGGGAWERSNKGLILSKINCVKVHPWDPSIVYAGTTNGIFMSSDGGSDWEQSGLAFYHVGAVEIDPAMPSNIYAGTGTFHRTGRVFKSEDGGKNWIQMKSCLGVQAIAVDPINPATVYLSDYSTPYFAGIQIGHIYKSEDGGESWVKVLFISSPIYCLVIDPDDPATIYAGAHFRGIYKSTDGGNNWIIMGESLNNLRVRILSIDPDNPNVFYAGTNEGIYKSTDSGENWTPANNGLSSLSIQTMIMNPKNSSTLYAGTLDGGVFFTENGAESWAPMNEGLTNTDVQCLAQNSYPSTIYAGTNGGGVFSLSFADVFSIFSAHVVDDVDWWTRLSVINTGPVDNAVYFQAIDAEGETVDMYKTDTLPPSALLDLNAAELFNAGTFDKDIWVRVSSLSPLEGVLLFGTGDRQSAAAMPMFSTPVTEFIFPYVYVYPEVEFSYYTGLTMINTGDRETNITLEAFSEAGEHLATHQAALAAGGKYVRLADQIFDGVDPFLIRFVTAASDQPIIGFELFGKWGEIGLSGMPACTPPDAAVKGDRESYEIVYNEIPDNDEYYTGVTVSSLGEESANLYIRLRDADGRIIKSGYWPWQVAGGEQITREIWGFVGDVVYPDAALLEISSNQPLLGFELYMNRDTQNNYRFDGIMGVSEGSTELVFPLVLTETEWESTLSLTNLNEDEVAVTVFAYNSNGMILDSISELIPPQGRMQKCIAEMFPDVEENIWILVTGDGMIVGSILSVSQDLSRMVSYIGLNPAGSRSK